MGRVTARPKEKEEQPAAPPAQQPRPAARLPLAWRIVFAVWATAFLALVLFEGIAFVWKALRSSW